MSEKRLKFLYEATKVVPTNVCGTFIRCQLLSKCHATTNVNLPAQNFKASIICQGCGIELSDNPPRTIIKSPPKPTKSIKKLKKMLDKNKILTPYQQNIYNSFASKNYQRLITVCVLCDKKNTVKLLKPRLNVLSSISEESKNVQRTSKKKKKDLFSGLNKAAVLSSSKNNPIQKIKKKRYLNPIITINETVTTINLVQNKSNETNNNKNLDFIPLGQNSLNMSGMGKISLTKNNNSKKMNKRKNRKTKSKHQNNIKNIRIQKNKVLKKTEKNENKNVLKMKNLANILKKEPSTSNSLSNFLNCL